VTVIGRAHQSRHAVLVSRVNVNTTGQNAFDFFNIARLGKSP
jgi:hypothetical protein